MTSRCRSWLELVRISNAPTVVSNALAGCALAIPATAAFPWQQWGGSAAALVLLYSAGMAMNDACDATTDRDERPHRPIPSGRISRTSAAAFVIAATVIALVLLTALNWRAGVAGAALTLCILLYNVTHRLHPATVLLMAGCRVLAIITAACAAGWRPEGAGGTWLTDNAPRYALALGAYVIALSLVARGEAGDRRRIRIVVAMVCAISLLDASVLAYLERWPQAALAVACFILSAFAQRRILGS